MIFKNFPAPTPEVMPLIYVAGPYRAATERQLVLNIRMAETAALYLWQNGYAALCPHMNTAHFGGAAPDEVWLKGDLVMMERCDGVLVCPGYEKSSGTLAEIARAKEIGLPVRYYLTHEE